MPPAPRLVGLVSSLAVRNFSQPCTRPATRDYSRAKPRPRVRAAPICSTTSGWSDLIGDRAAHVTRAHNVLTQSRPGAARWSGLVYILKESRPLSRSFKSKPSINAKQAKAVDTSTQRTVLCQIHHAMLVRRDNDHCPLTFPIDAYDRSVLGSDVG